MTQPSPAGAPKPRPGNLVTAGLLVSLLALLAAALVTTAGAQGPRRNTPLIQDWSHRHVIFPNNPNRPMSLGGPQGNIRAWLAWLQRNAWAFQVSTSVAPSPSRPPVSLFPNRPQNKGFKTDWAMSLGSNTAGNGVAQNMYPAKFTWDVAAPPECTKDFVVFPINSTPAPGPGGQANIVAFNQLYRGPGGTGTCPGGSTPDTLWAYQVGVGRIKTSPALLYDSNGTKVAFVESRTSSAIFHVLTWMSGEGTLTSPAVPGENPGSTSSIRSVTYATASGANATNTRSSPFVDYDNDVVYVGADDGYLYKISPVFGAGNFNVQSVLVTSGAQLTGPVYDFDHSIVFVSDGAIVKAYSSSLAPLGQVSLAPLASNGISDTPVLDVTNHLLYVVTKTNVSSTNAAIVQIHYNPPNPPSSFFDTPVSGNIGATGGNPLHTGAFDNSYYGNINQGTLYVCGNRGVLWPTATSLYAFTFIGGVMQTTPLNDPNLGREGQCSPMTEFYNPNTPPLEPKDMLFVGHTGESWIQMWDITTRITNSTTTPKRGTEASGGSSGIVVDNYSTAAQASSIYFGTLGVARSPCKVNGTDKICAVKLTQLTLE
jgi:hypothetical protein